MSEYGKSSRRPNPPTATSVKDRLCRPCARHSCSSNLSASSANFRKSGAILLGGRRVVLSSNACLSC